ncbi:MAG: hypothetical protein AAGF36_05825 [Pseudomonadota bacterium]
MKMIFKTVGLLLAGVVFLAIGALGYWHLTNPSPSVSAAQSGSTTTFDADTVVVLVDGDMSGTAYADGVLHPVPDAADQLVLIPDLNAPNSASPGLPVSNTVMGWPGSLVLSPDGRFAYALSSRGAVDRSIETVDNVWDGIPPARSLKIIDLDAGAIVAEYETCEAPLSADISSEGTWLLVACGNNETQLQVIELQDGLPTGSRDFALDLPAHELMNEEPGARYAMIHPSGSAAGVLLHNRAVTLVRFKLDESGVPTSADAETPADTDGWLSVARWTPSGDHLLVADVAWGPRPTDGLFNGPGRVLSFALSPDDEARGIVSEANVSLSPEAFELNRAGDLLAVVNMERSYLPGGPLALAPGRGASSLSLVAVDDATGAVTALGDPVGFPGVLPEDAAFDADGDRLTVVVYQDHDAPKSDGWLAHFEVQSTAEGPRAVLLETRTPLPRGGHDLAVRY